MQQSGLRPGVSTGVETRAGLRQSMRRVCVLAGVSGVLASGLMALPAAAEERTCRGSLGAITVDNLRVPAGATCRLTGTKVKGSITVGSSATLVAYTVRVVGNVQAENAAAVTVAKKSTIGGSYQVKQGGVATIVDSRVTGDIQIDANRKAVRASRNGVGGSVQVVGNSGGASIYTNVINGNLQCKENAPAPTGGGNVVGGNKEDQCRRF